MKGNKLKQDTKIRKIGKIVFSSDKGLGRKALSHTISELERVLLFRRVRSPDILKVLRMGIKLV